MKVFWIIIALLAIAGAWFAWRPDGAEVAAPSVTAPPALAAPQANHPTTPSTDAPSNLDAQPVQPVQSPSAAAPTTVPDPAKALVDDLLSASAPATPPPSTSAPIAAAGSHTGHVGAGAGNIPTAPVVTIDPATIPATTGPAKIEQQDDGSFLVDDKYVIRGDGSPEHPYQLTWDLLVSASKTYQPRAGLTEIPDRVKMLDGKHIRITGYFAFPLAVQQTDEALVMMNMWDGCCIGVPPSPYDALEVRLTEPVLLNTKRFFNYGTLDGVLKVDPYIVNDWLLGLYLVEDGVLEWGGL